MSVLGGRCKDPAMKDLPAAPRYRAPQVRPAYRLLKGGHASVSGLMNAVPVLDDARRSGNATTKGRMSTVEVDVLRAAIVLTSASLDAAMKRLVNDMGRALISVPGTSARGTYERYLKQELAKPSVRDDVKDAIVRTDPGEALLEIYLADRTKASFQGSGDLRIRVKSALGIANADVADSRLSLLDDFFIARNAISHDMDYLSGSSHSVKRIHRAPQPTETMCTLAFEVGVELIHGAGIAAKYAGL